eukprot:30612-Pelagococcus_subviridis.AAC.32
MASIGISSNDASGTGDPPLGVRWCPARGVGTAGAKFGGMMFRFCGRFFIGIGGGGAVGASSKFAHPSIGACVRCGCGGGGGAGGCCCRADTNCCDCCNCDCCGCGGGCCCSCCCC